MTLLDSPPTARGEGVPPQIQLDDLLVVTGGRLVGPTTTTAFSTASVDSRRITAGCCFVALRGERVDGHCFVGAALEAGASVAIVERPVERPAGSTAAVVEVDDSLVALQELAAWWRSRSAVRVVGITGSTGKTIAKELTADVLGRRLSVLRSEGNLNSETGLPMTLLRLDHEQHEVAVLEMGMYTVGEIARLAEIARPEVGVVLAVHPTHLLRAGSIERIAEGKSELPRSLPADGLAVLNADDRYVAAMRAITPAPSITFGLTDAADVRATDIEVRGLAGTTFTIEAPWGRRRVASASPGRYLVPHALAATAVAERFGVSLYEVEAALAAGSRAPHRMAVLTARTGATLVDDSYNASPVSVIAALDFLADTPLPRGERRLTVLGDMLELGPDEEAAHRRVGARAAQVVEGLVTVGPRARWIADAARAAGLARQAHADDAEDAVEATLRTLDPRQLDLLLVKASRGVELDALVAALT